MMTPKRILLGVVLAAALGVLLLHLGPSRVAGPQVAASKANAISPLPAGRPKPVDHSAHDRRVRMSLVNRAELPVNVRDMRYKYFPIASDGTTPVPERYQLPGVARVRTASSFGDWVNQYPVEDRKRITAFNTRYRNVYEVASPQQIAWMARNGYPMPEDLIAAQGIDDHTLQDLAAAGNVKANFLLNDRLLDRLGDRTEQDLDLSNPADRVLSAALSKSDALSLHTASAFKGYVEVAEAYKHNNDPVDQKAYLISGLFRAMQLGDGRVLSTLMQLSSQGIISDSDFAIASQIYVDMQMERGLIPGARCPDFTSLGPMPPVVVKGEEGN